MTAREENSGAGQARSNRLAQEKSPYLLQHANNPVDWYPWSEEAFVKARAENKPIFLSIGYSTCHWCHVMAHESFENENVAAIMNREFVNIKVDREERPDVDRVYMTFVQATTGGGGWPMSVWLTPDLQPFVGGTYFPPVDRHGHPAFSTVLQRIAAGWKSNREKIVEQGARIVEALQEAQASAAAEEGKASKESIEAAFAQFVRTFDPGEGGFGNAPKFPRPVSFNFLTRYYARDPQGDAGRRALEINNFTLRKMAAGGMHDHLGGGFHRYSVDRFWHVPHFEKMLYDQAQLAVAYLEAFQITRAPGFERVARDILDYVGRDMTAKNGGFFSAEDADSLLAHGKPEHAEGAFYVWGQAEIEEALGDAAAMFNFHYGVEPSGNAEAGDPHGEFEGKNILIVRQSPGETAARFGKTEQETVQTLAQAREKLFRIREKRPRPHLDDKILAGWNGLMISAFARAAEILGDADYLRRAICAARFLRDQLWDDTRKRLFRSYREGRSEIAGFADDYAFVIQAMLDLYRASFEVEWLRFARELQEIQDDLFWDDKSGGYFSTSGQDRSVVLRMKDDNDSAEPAASSVAALNLLRFAQIFDDHEMRERGERTIAAFTPTLSRFASAMPQMLVALDFSLSKPRQIVIAGKRESAETKMLLEELRGHFLPDAVVLLADGADGQKYLGEKNEALRAMSLVGGKPAAYVCENFTCKAPVTDAEALRGLLGSS